MSRVVRLIALAVTLVGVCCAAATTAQPAVVPTVGAIASPAATPAATPNVEFAGAGPVRLVPVVDGLVDPVTVTNAGDGSGRLFVAERRGTVRIIAEGRLLAEPFLDLSADVKIDFREQGLLGLAFHPKYRQNGLFYVCYNEFFSNGNLIVARYQVSAGDPNQADPTSRAVILTQEERFIYHNGGTIRFGPDGYLYVGMGDGGDVDAQELDTLLGKILRIDIDVDPERRVPYAIPPGNIVQTAAYVPEARPEIWAYGVRNPWQFSFDRATGDLYIPDVGENTWEEINFQAATDGGGRNYGWKAMEGTDCFVETNPQCEPIGIEPAVAYRHGDAGCAVAGIGVFHDRSNPHLDGNYVFSDFCSGTLWGMRRDVTGTWVQVELAATPLHPTGGGVGESGELYLTSCDCLDERSGTAPESANGAVWRLIGAHEVPPDAVMAPVQSDVDGAPEPEPKTAEATPRPEFVTRDIAFDPITLALPAHEPTEIVLRNAGALPHTFTIDALAINVALAAGETRSVTIAAPPGVYDFVCVIPGHKAAGMTGTLTVR